LQLQAASSAAHLTTRQATDEFLEEADMRVNVALCDLVNSSFHRFGKGTVKAFKVEMLRARNPHVQGLILTALEMCMHNCG